MRHRREEDEARSQQRDGSGAFCDSSTGDVSDDGRFVVFSSICKNVPSDTNGRADIYSRGGSI